MSNFIIGTANFTQAYGSSSSCLKKSDIEAILEDALLSGICELDTAESYGSIEKVIPKSILDNFKIRTKLVIDSSTCIDRCCDSILSKFRNVEAVLVHNAEDLPLETLCEKLELMKSRLNDSLVGVSIYNNIDILKLSCIETVQLPHNILNKPLNTLSGVLLKDLDIVVRSVFLQGVLLKERRCEDAQFHFIREYIQLIAESYNLSPMSFLLALVKSKSLRPVLGFRNFTQFKELISSYESLPRIYNDYHIITKPIIYDPRLWKRE